MYRNYYQEFINKYYQVCINNFLQNNNISKCTFQTVIMCI